MGADNQQERLVDFTRIFRDCTPETLFERIGLRYSPNCIAIYRGWQKCLTPLFK